jgi:hypothetical protein
MTWRRIHVQIPYMFSFSKSQYLQLLLSEYNVHVLDVTHFYSEGSDK